jgi:hypothetical protein
MSKQSIIVKSDPALREAEPAELEVIEPTRTATPFVSFSYSITEVSSFAGRTRVKSRTTRMTDGRLVSEKFDGELEGSAYERMAMQAGEQLVGQLRLLMQPFSWLLPFPRDRDK